MSAFVASAAIAVSVTVIGTGPAPVKHYWETPTQATLSEAVDQWAASAGLPKPEIDARVATVAVGQVSVSGDNVCEAVAKLVSALKYADQRPQLRGCGSSAAPITISLAAR
jgi:hypothetical protein